MSFNASHKPFAISISLHQQPFEIPLGSWSYEIGIFMMHERQFGEIGGHVACCAAFRRDDSTRIVILRAAFARRTSLRFCIRLRRDLRPVPISLVPTNAEPTQITTHHSPITAFLIDTPAIRIAPKSCACIVAAHSNRHSSGALELHHNRAIPSNPAPRFGLDHCQSARPHP
jgi:hypothetical protein